MLTSKQMIEQVAATTTEADLVVEGYLRAKYARLLISMSIPEAKQILGFPPSSNPSPEEIAKAYKAKAIANHPDKGGTHEKMVEINVAKDLLDGKGKASPPQRSPGYPPGGWTPADEVPRRQKQEIEDTIKGEPFEAAWGSSGAPAGTEWKFVSIPQWDWDVPGHPGHRVWVMYGQTDQKHVFVALKERGESAGGVWIDKKFTKIEEDWQSSMIDAPIAQNIAKIALKNIKSVASGWAESNLKFDTPNKFIAWPGGKPTKQIIEKIPRSGGAALKDILLGVGLLADEDPSIAGRKSVVEIYTKYSQEKVQKARANKNKYITIVDQYDFFIRINGKAEQLADDTVQKMTRIIIPYVFNWEVTEGRPKNLTRLRGGRFKTGPADAIKEMVNCLTSEPSWVHIALEKAAEEYETDPVKKAMKDPLVAEVVAASDPSSEKVLEQAYFHTSNGGLILSLFENSGNDYFNYRVEYKVNTFGLNGSGGFSLDSSEVVDWLANALLRTKPLLAAKELKHSYSPISKTYVNVENGVSLRVASEYLRQLETHILGGIQKELKSALKLLG